MTNSIESLEKGAFRAFWNDGILDIMLGLVVLILGLSWWQDVAVLGAVFPAICASMWVPLRRKLIEPRMGFVEFSGPREIKVRTFLFGLAAFFTGTTLLGAVIFFMWNSDVLPRPADWVAGFPLLLIAVPAIFFALFTQCKRFFVYAFVLVMCAIELIYQGWDPHVGLMASGGFMLVSGSYILLRFLLSHPLQSPGSL